MGRKYECGDVLAHERETVIRRGGGGQWRAKVHAKDGKRVVRV